MRIALLAPAWNPIPPDRYGGTEAVVAYLADALVARGHEVVLFASGGSRTAAELAATHEVAPSEWIGWTVPDLHHVLQCYERAGEFGVISEHSGLLGIAMSAMVRTPTACTIHFSVEREARDILQRLARLNPRLSLVSISRSQRTLGSDLPWVANCPNGLPLQDFEFSARPGDYLLFVGRMSPAKGVHHAIAVARAAGLPLRIAAKMREPWEREYFDAHVRPALGPEVVYLGEVGHREKVELYRDALATVFPIEWPEPFGMVVIESLACGTPVIATAHGAVRELIDDGTTGFVVPDVAAMVAAVRRVGELDRAACRAAVASRFSAERMARDYERAFVAALRRSGGD